jgi:hypothetical protein
MGATNKVLAKEFQETICLDVEKLIIFKLIHWDLTMKGINLIQNEF